MPESSKTQLSLAKAEPISIGGNASLLRRGKKKIAVEQQPERGVRIYVRNSSADTKVSAEAGRGRAPSTRAEIFLQPVVKIMSTRLCTCSTWRTPRQSKWMTRGCDPVETLWCSRFQASGEEEADKIRSEVVPERKGGWGKRILNLIYNLNLNFKFICHYPTLICLVIN